MSLNIVQYKIVHHILPQPYSEVIKIKEQDQCHPYEHQLLKTLICIQLTFPELLSGQNLYFGGMPKMITSSRLMAKTLFMALRAVCSPIWFSEVSEPLCLLIAKYHIYSTFRYEDHCNFEAFLAVLKSKVDTHRKIKIKL